MESITRSMTVRGAFRSARRAAVASALVVPLLAPAHVAATSLPTGFVEEVLVAGLDFPIGMAFLPDGRLLVTERSSAKVRVIVAGHVAAVDPALTVPDVTSADLERGLQGIAVDPRWPVFPYVYVCFTRTGDRMALVRYTGAGALDDPAGEDLSFGSPLVLIDDFTDNNSVHNGLCLRFGVDGRLLMSTGDDFDHCSAQNPASLRGVLLRLDVSRLPAAGGGPVPRALLIPPDNPLSGPDSNVQLVLAYGLRNPWRFHVDPGTGAILVADVGAAAFEELDEIRPGDNLGWPFREGPLIHARPECGPDTAVYQAPIAALDHAEGFASIMTAGIYRPVPGGSANWPSEYWGNLFYGDVFFARLRRLLRSGNAWVSPPPVPGQPAPDDWATDLHLSSDFAVGPDGSLYWLKMWDGNGEPETGSLRRIRYIGPTVSVPDPLLDPRALRAVPNPFHQRVELRWEARSPSGELEILDLAGRVVGLIQSRPVGGAAQADWSGVDAAGRAVPSGLYWARVRGEPEVKPARLLLIR